MNAFSKTRTAIAPSPVISALIARKTKMTQNQEAIKIGNIEYQFTRSFCLLIFTKNDLVLSNNDLNIKTEILNFGVYEAGFQERLIKVILEIEGGEAEKSRLENNQFLLERINKVSRNQSVILNRLNKHNDYTLLDDTQFVQVLQSSEIENKTIKKEIEVRKNMKAKLKDQRTYLKDFTNLITSLYYTFKNLDGEITEGSEISPQLFLAAFKKVIALNERIETIHDYNEDNVINDTIERLFSVLSKGIPGNQRLYYAVSFGVKTLKFKNSFSKSLWNYATKLKEEKKSQSGRENFNEALRETETGGVWASVKKIRKIIPHLSMEDLPKLTTSFRPKAGQSLLESIYSNLKKPIFSKYTSIEKLAICKAFIPENFLTSMKVFSYFANPKMLHSENFRDLGEFFAFADYHKPIICYADKSLDVAGLCEDLKVQTNSPGYKIIFCGSDSFERCERYLEKAMLKGYFVVINSIHLNPDWERKLAHWIRNMQEKREKSRGYGKL